MELSFKKISSTTTLCAGMLITSQSALAGASGNIGVTNNYIWRGVTQSDDQAAVSGGLDYAADNGLYVGTWLSNVDFVTDKGTELDLYAGYAKELSNGFSYDVGVIRYMYPGERLSGDFNEVSAKLGFKGFGLELAHDWDNDNTYYAGSYGGEIKEGLEYGLKVGQYEFDGDGDYTHYQASLTKGDFTFAVDDNNLDGSAGDPVASVSYSKSFDF